MTRELDLNKLLSIAKDCDICHEGYKKILSGNRNTMLDYYLQIPDWCLERSFPSIEDIYEEWNDCEEYGIFVGKKFKGETLSGLQTYVFHNCSGHIRVAMDYEKAIIPMLYFANNCRISVACNQKENKGNPIVIPAYIFGKNEVKIKDSLYGRFNRINRELIK